MGSASLKITSNSGGSWGKTYVFRVAVEPDEDRWIAYSLALKDQGGATWSYTREEALENILQVLHRSI